MLVQQRRALLYDLPLLSDSDADAIFVTCLLLLEQIQGFFGFSNGADLAAGHPMCENQGRSKPPQRTIWQTFSRQSVCASRVQEVQE